MSACLLWRLRVSARLCDKGYFHSGYPFSRFFQLSIRKKKHARSFILKNILKTFNDWNNTFNLRSLRQCLSKDCRDWHVYDRSGVFQAHLIAAPNCPSIQSLVFHCLVPNQQASALASPYPRRAIHSSLNIHQLPLIPRPVPRVAASG
jgi:hypothetical protein